MIQVHRILLHPIKGLDPVRVDEAGVLASGALEFDRRWAMVDARGRFVNGKLRPKVHSVRAEYDLAKLEVALNGKTLSLAREGEDIARWFSEMLGDPVEWRENAEAGFPDDTDSPGPTFVSTASVERVAEWFGLDVEAARLRFRTNVEFGGSEAFWEDRLYGGRFQVGAVTVEAVNPCQRCIVPSRDARTGERIANFQQRFSELRQQNMPAEARTALFSHYYRFAVNTRITASEAGKVIRVGDPLLVTSLTSDGER